MPKQTTTRPRFTKRPTPEQVRQGLALFALAKPLADEARRTRDAAREIRGDAEQITDHRQETGTCD